MGFNQTAVKTAVEGARAGGRGASALPARLRLRLKSAESGIFELTPRQASAVLLGSYQKGIPSLVRTYEMMSAAGMRVLSPSGRDFVAEMDGLLQSDQGAEAPPEAVEWLPLNCIRAADLVWLHAPDGYVGLSGALEIGFANAAGVPVYAEEVPSDLGLRSLVTISPLEQVLAKARTGEKDDPEASLLPLQAYYSAVAQGRAPEQKSPQDVVSLITEEIGELARQSPGQRQRRARSSRIARRLIGVRGSDADRALASRISECPHSNSHRDRRAKRLVHRCRARHRCRNATIVLPSPPNSRAGTSVALPEFPGPEGSVVELGPESSPVHPWRASSLGWERVAQDRLRSPFRVRRPVYSTWRVGV